MSILPRILDKDIPEGQFRCPVCDGTGKTELSEQDKSYSWNKGKTHYECHNCGGQYMYSTAKGYVGPNKEGVGCKHSYTGRNVGRCLTEYVCSHCNSHYQIDSGD